VGKHGDSEERNLPGLYGAVQAGIWLVGLAILAWRGWWFPGILVLVAISGITQAVLQKWAANDEAKAQAAKAAEQEKAQIARAAQQAAAAVPANCPTCGAAISAAAVTWTGPTTARCPYCKAAIPLKIDAVA
jgi:predicted Zn-ribbon and HTH transcriptional regulator